jgi:hypothetical protein
VWRLHMIAEPFIAERTLPAVDAHVRIDDWGTALGWIQEKFAGREFKAAQGR